MTVDFYVKKLLIDILQQKNNNFKLKSQFCETCDFTTKNDDWTTKVSFLELKKFFFCF